MKKMFTLLLVLSIFSIMTLCASCGGNPATEPSETSPVSSSGTTTSNTSPTNNTSTSPSNTPSGSSTNTSPTGNTGTVYKIADYYDANGGLSALGLTLGVENSERVLKVQAGDVLVVGTSEYSVTAQSLTIPFYTQPSLTEVTNWWTEYCENRVGRGEMK